jgi:hypothetical protein
MTGTPASVLRSLWCAAVAFLACSVCPALAETRLRVASWNIANFHHQPGVELRSGIGTKRQPADFEALKRYADSLEADVIALQEIGTKEAAQALFPDTKFSVFMEGRYTADIQSGPSKEIYTAVAVRRRSDIKVVEQNDISGLEIEETADDGTKHATRRGAAVKLDVSGTPLWFVSVHLKSSCSTTNRLDTSVRKTAKLFGNSGCPSKRSSISARQTVRPLSSRAISTGAFVSFNLATRSGHFSMEGISTSRF